MSSLTTGKEYSIVGMLQEKTYFVTANRIMIKSVDAEHIDGKQPQAKISKLHPVDKTGLGPRRGSGDLLTAMPNFANDNENCNPRLTH